MASMSPWPGRQAVTAVPRNTMHYIDYCRYGSSPIIWISASAPGEFNEKALRRFSLAYGDGF
jgi:hypothetical protein